MGFQSRRRRVRADDWPGGAFAGDNYLLFSDFRFDFSGDLPIEIAPGVLFSRTPQPILDRAEPSAQADFVLPGYNLPGTGLVNCCLRSPAGAELPEGTSASEMFFRAIMALRLYGPLPVSVAGQFELGDCGVFRHMRLYNLHSPWQPIADARYTVEALTSGRKIVDRVLEIEGSAAAKTMRAIEIFQQVSCGYSKSELMAYLALFSALEFLYQPAINQGPGSYFRVLRDRIASSCCRYLESVEFGMESVY